MRLIDADELMMRLRCNVLIDVTPELEKEIEQQPTAFDKKKVIEKIKDESREERLEDVSISGNVYGYNIERVINEEDVIEIIEKEEGIE